MRAYWYRTLRGRHECTRVPREDAIEQEVLINAGLRPGTSTRVAAIEQALWKLLEEPDETVRYEMESINRIEGPVFTYWCALEE